MRVTRSASVLLAGTVMLLAGPAFGARYDLDIGPGFKVLWDNQASIGAGVRISERNKDFVGKSNLNPDLCAEDACISVNPDNLEPHERWMAAPGADWQISDDGDLNYDQGDLVSGLVKWRSELKVRHDDWGLQLSWYAFYDQVNAQKKTNRENIILNPSEAPGRDTDVERPGTMEETLGYDFDLRLANVFFRVPLWGDRELDVRIGRQIYTWGEALFTINGGLNFINPTNFNNFFRPAADLSETRRPVSLVKLGTNLTRNVRLEGFYQFEWRPFELPARDALWSFVADIGTEEAPDDAFPLPFGKSPEDPYLQQQNANPVLGLVSDSSLAADRSPNREPSDTGQYGIKLRYFADWLGDTELGLYYANYHARVPSVSMIAAQASCARREGNPMGIDASNVVEFFTACGLNPTGPANGENLTNRDATPIDSAKILAEFPEDIHLWGLSFNTQAWNTAFAGEIAYRPNQPFQVDAEDLFFTALQPVFPRETIEIIPQIPLGLGEQVGGSQLDNTLLGLLGLPGFDDLEGATLADSERALPAYLNEFRGGTPGEVAPGSYVRGYERMDMWQGSVSATRIYGNTTQILGADSLVLLFEVSAAYVPDLPPLDELQFDSLLTSNRHFSPGIEETRDALKLNPHKEDAAAFPDKFSWGYKTGVIASYNNVLIDGLQLRPQIFLFHDVDGITPGLAGNFQEGRKIGVVGLQTSYGNVEFDITNFLFWGGGDGNRLRDRDYVNVSLSYRF